MAHHATPALVLGTHPIVLGLLMVLFLFICVVLILTVLIQKPSGGGLSGAFGSGAGSGQTAFGARTGDALTIATIIMFGVFVLSSIALNLLVSPARPGAVPAAATTGAPAGGAGAPAAPAGNAADLAPQPEAPAGQAPPEETPAEPVVDPAGEENAG
jgi:preprotein translocase subunit SecG